jgi:biotin transport system substrate-specific component
MSVVTNSFVQAKHSVLTRVFGIVGFAGLLALAAALRVPLPFTPVPVTLQTLVVLMAGVLLGSRAAVSSVGLYIGLGLMGVPLFTGMGAGSLYLLGPTGGYLVGFLAAAGWVGSVRPAMQRAAWPARWALMASGIAIIYFCGALWLMVGFRWGLPQVWTMGIAPFLAADLVKAGVAAGCVRRS